VVLVTAMPALADEVARVAAAAAVRLVQVGSFQESAVLLNMAGAVLIGSDMQHAPAAPGCPAVLVGLAGTSGALWRHAADAGIERVAVLPEAAEWLAGYLGRLRDPVSGGTVIGVAGGCGGAGASTLSVLLAAWAAGEGIEALLVDGDEWGGGLELALSPEGLSGLRWPDLAGASGTINPAQLAASLPVTAGFSLLSWGQESHAAVHPLRSGALGAEVLAAARRGFRLCVVDLGRGREAVEGLAQFCDLLIVVVPARLRPVVASAQLLGRLPPLPTSVVVRGPLREGLDPEIIARSLGLPLASYLPGLRGAPAAAERGELASLARLRPVRRLGRAVLGLAGSSAA
jgi:secretion/DNA translocation related CpaE-like protein